MNLSPIEIAQHSIVLLGAGGPPLGKAAFMGVFVLLVIWLIWLPGRLIGQTDGPPVWWRNTRVWAIIIATLQVLAYWQLG